LGEVSLLAPIPSLAATSLAFSFFPFLASRFLNKKSFDDFRIKRGNKIFHAALSFDFQHSFAMGEVSLLVVKAARILESN
jgi:hypothetical protein